MKPLEPARMTFMFAWLVVGLEFGETGDFGDVDASGLVDYIVWPDVRSYDYEIGCVSMGLLGVKDESVYLALRNNDDDLALELILISFLLFLSISLSASL